MREKVATILFIIVFAFIAVFFGQVFWKLFIQPNTQFSTSAASAFFGAFLAFLFIRLGDFFKSYSDRITKGHSALVKAEYLLNSLLSELDDNIYVIETFEKLYENNVKSNEDSHVFLWANRLTPVKGLDEVLIDLLNIDLINELFTLNVDLRKLNASMETINGAYKESKDALISKVVDPSNYLENLTRIRKDLHHIKKFFSASITETARALSAVRVLSAKRPLIGYLLIKLPSYRYNRRFKAKREAELKTLLREMKEIKESSKARIYTILEADRRNE